MSDERCEGGDRGDRGREREMETGKRMARSSVSEWSPKGDETSAEKGGRVKRGDAG